MTTLVYRYGLHAPHEGGDLVREQIWRSHRFRNTLIEIERGRRAAVRQLELDAGLRPAVLALEQASAIAKAAHATIAKHRAQSRKRDETAEMRHALNEARQAETFAAEALREMRWRLKPLCEACRRADVPSPCPHASPEAIALLNRADVISDRAKDLAKNAYEYAGIFWGQRALVTDAAAQSFADLPMYDLHGNPNDPRFERWDGAGAVGLQIMGGLCVDELHGCGDARLQLRPPDPRAWSGVVAERRRYGSTAELSLRVGSEGRAPIWARWICDMDRPLPEGSRIVWATVHLRQRGPWSEWSVSLTLDASAVIRAHRAPISPGAVAVDVGWRVDGERLRVAAWADEHGAGDVLALDRPLLNLFQMANLHRQARDLAFNGARLGLAWWRRTFEGTVPEWLSVEISRMRQWHDPGRLFRTWVRWSRERFEGDDRAYSLLTAWKWRNEKLWSDEAKTRLQALRRRKDLYRVFAARLADRYGTIVLEKFDKRSVAKREALSEVRPNEVARANRQLAATSTLSEAIVHAARARGRICMALPAAYTTRICPFCGVVENRKAADSILLHCDACGATWDQDRDGATRVLLARLRERPGDGQILVDARVEDNTAQPLKKKGDRYRRAKRLRAEKDARMAAARKAEDIASE